MKDVRDEGKLNAAQADVFAMPRAHEELFDCLQDPQQLSNVASNEKYVDELIDLRAIMQQWISETGDDVPDHLTPAWYDPETGEALKIDRKRGEMPRTKTKAVENNNKGPY